MGRNEKLLNILASAIARFIVGFAVAAFLFVAFGYRIMRPTYDITVVQFALVCAAIGVVCALFAFRNGSGIK